MPVPEPSAISHHPMTGRAGPVARFVEALGSTWRASCIRVFGCSQQPRKHRKNTNPPIRCQWQQKRSLHSLPDWCQHQLQASWALQNETGSPWSSGRCSAAPDGSMTVDQLIKETNQHDLIWCWKYIYTSTCPLSMSYIYIYAPAPAPARFTYIHIHT